jgi:phosphoribosylformylglycinamidine cyclo-ligase
MPLKFTYQSAGVDQEAEDALMPQIFAHMRRTFGPQVLSHAGGYGGLFSLNRQTKLLGRHMKTPVLVAGADGVGTKLKIAFMMDKHDTVGIDLVAMSVNDILCQGAKPLFFLDYIATGRLDATRIEKIIKGVADGCELADCALLGGETAQMPDFYGPGEYDLAGFAVGVVDIDRVMDPALVQPGHVVLGLASNGLHSNGFSLVRKVLFDHAKMNVTDHVAELGGTLGEELLRPTRIYVRSVQALRTVYEVKRIPTGVCHITGGGMAGNIPRIVPEGCVVRVKRGSWPVPPIFDVIQKTGELDDEEMFSVFNMGLGMTLIVPPYYADACKRRLEQHGETVYVVGDVREGKRGVTILK